MHTIVPLADGVLGRDVVRVIYAAYVAAEEGRRVELDLPPSGDAGRATIEGGMR